MKRTISGEEYRKDPAYSRSDIFNLSKSPAHFKYAKENPRSETGALVFGAAFHAFVLERDKFDKKYIVTPKKTDKRTKEGKALAALIEASGKIQLTSEQYGQIEAMAASIMSNRYASALLKNGEHEKSYFWRDSLTGISLKCRPDCRTELKTVSVIADIKTTENAETDSFMKSCIKYGYDLQAAMYKQGVETVENKPHKFIFIAVEKSPPYVCNILEADEIIIKKGSQDLTDYLYTLKDCLETDNWYGYNGKDGSPNVISLPAWLAKEYE